MCDGGVWPHYKGVGEEMERFKNYLDKVLDRVGNGYTMCVLGGLIGWTEIGLQWVELVHLEFKKKMIMKEEWLNSVLKSGNKYFKQKSLHKYNRVARGQDKTQVKSMIDLVLIKKGMLSFVQVVRTVRRMGSFQIIIVHYIKLGW